MKSFIISILREELYNDQVNKNETGRESSMHREKIVAYRILVRKTREKRDLDIGEKIILRWILEK
jgi:hypothetical protein